MKSALSWAGYAATTKKTPGESREAIEVALKRYGANGFAYAHDDEHAIAWVAFAVDKVRVRISVNLPRREDCKSDSAYEQRLRTRWRMFLLLARARLESVAHRVQTLEEAFLPDLVTASGATVAEVLSPVLAMARATGTLPVLTMGAAPPAPLPALAPSAPLALPAALAVREDEVTEAEIVKDDDDDPPPSGPAPTGPRGQRRGKGSIGSHRELDLRVPNQEIVPVDRLTRGADHFACRPLGWTMQAKDCLARQSQAVEAERRQGKEGVCFECGQGALVAARLASVTRAA
jgi:hypothetical protein